MPVFLFPVRVMFLFTFSALFFTLLFPLIPWASSLFVLITVPGLCVCFSVQASPPSHFFIFFSLSSPHLRRSCPANAAFAHLSRQFKVSCRDSLSIACVQYLRAGKKKKKKPALDRYAQTKCHRSVRVPQNTQGRAADTVRGSKGITGQKQLSTERRQARQWGTFTLLRRTLREQRKLHAQKTHTHTHTHTHSLPASLSDMPNNDLSSVSVSLSPLQVACCCCLPLCHVSLLPPSTRCALQYHSNHNLILTKRIPTQQRDVSLRITN